MSQLTIKETIMRMNSKNLKIFCIYCKGQIHPSHSSTCNSQSHKECWDAMAEYRKGQALVRILNQERYK